MKNFLKAKSYKLKVYPVTKNSNFSVTGASQGFTLIELLVVIAIIGILAGIILTSLSTARNKANDAAAISSLSELRSQAEIFASGNNNKYGNCTVGYKSDGTPTGQYNGSLSNPINLCNDSQIQKLLKYVTSKTGNNSTLAVGGDGNSWIAYVKLTGTDFYCVDNAGSSEKTTGTLITTGTPTTHYKAGDIKVYCPQ